MGAVLEGGTELGWGDRVVGSGTEAKCGVQRSVERGAYSKRVREGKREEGWMRGRKTRRKTKKGGKLEKRRQRKARWLQYISKRHTHFSFLFRKAFPYMLTLLRAQDMVEK